MPYVNSQGLRIHYQSDGDGPPLVFLHGATSTLQTWYELGYVDRLKQKYRCILIDLRGRGASDKPHEPAAYALSCYVADIVAVLDTLQLRQALFMGFSLGGRIAFGMAKIVPERVQALIIGGQHAYAIPGGPFGPGKIDGTDPATFLTTFEARLGERLTPEKKAMILAHDLQAIAASLAGDMPSEEDILPRMKMPCLLYCGEADTRFSKVQACVTQMPKGTFVALPGLNHIEAHERSDLILPHITKFLHAVCAK
jgi:pimeloyl-ACP methyl ester carboxylesterase